MKESLPTSDYAQLSDDELVARYRNMDEKNALIELMRRYSGYIIAFALQHLRDREKVDDFTQDLFVRLSEKLPSAQVQHFKSWLYVVMRNMYYDQARRTRLHDQFLDWQKQAHAFYEIEGKLEEQLDRKQWQIALTKLNQNEQDCIRLIYLEEMDYAEIMRLKNWTFNQVRGFRQRGMQKLRAMLNPQSSAQ